MDFKGKTCETIVVLESQIGNISSIHQNYSRLEVNLDTKDKELIRLLAKDARQSAAELARELGLSRSTVQNRIDKLLSTGVIEKFTIEFGKHIDSPLVDAIVMVKLASGDSRQTIAQFKKLSELTALSSVNGVYDFVLELRVPSHQALDRVLTVIRSLPSVTETMSSIRLMQFK